MSHTRAVLTAILLALVCTLLLVNMAQTLHEQVSMVNALDRCRTCPECELQPDPPVIALDNEQGETLQIDDDVAVLSFFRAGKRRYVDLHCVARKCSDHVTALHGTEDRRG